MRWRRYFHVRSSFIRELWIPMLGATHWREPLLDHVRAQPRCAYFECGPECAPWFRERTCIARANISRPSDRASVPSWTGMLRIESARHVDGVYCCTGAERVGWDSGETTASKGPRVSVRRARSPASFDARVEQFKGNCIHLTYYCNCGSTSRILFHPGSYIHIGSHLVFS